MIRFLQPVWLVSAVPVLLLAGAYMWRARHRRSYAMKFTNVDLLHSIASDRVGWRRRFPVVTLILALLVLSTALARPTVDAKKPLERATIMLAVDVSLSMESTDVAPNRLRAAQLAATDFVTTMPPRYNVGLVAFANSADVLVSPTKDRSAITRAIDGLRLHDWTATGEAVYACLSAIRSVPADGASGPPPARIVLLSDGYLTVGRPIEQAAQAAAAAKVPVSTIAYGTSKGTVTIDGLTQAVPADRRSLRELAQLTHGHFYQAASVAQLTQVYQDLGSSIVFKTVPREVTQWDAGVALLCAFGAAGVRLFWSSRMI